MIAIGHINFFFRIEIESGMAVSAQESEVRASRDEDGDHHILRTLM